MLCAGSLRSRTSRLRSAHTCRCKITGFASCSGPCSGGSGDASGTRGAAAPEVGRRCVAEFIDCFFVFSLPGACSLFRQFCACNAWTGRSSTLSSSTCRVILPHAIKAPVPEHRVDCTFHMMQTPTSGARTTHWDSTYWCWMPSTSAFHVENASNLFNLVG